MGSSSPVRMPRSVSDHVSLAALYSSSSSAMPPSSAASSTASQYMERSPSMVWGGSGGGAGGEVVLSLVGGGGGGVLGGGSGGVGGGGSSAVNSSSVASGGRTPWLLRPWRCLARPRLLPILALAALRIAMVARHAVASLSADDVLYALKPADRWVIVY